MYGLAPGYQTEKVSLRDDNYNRRIRDRITEVQRLCKIINIINIFFHFVFPIVFETRSYLFQASLETVRITLKIWITNMKHHPQFMWSTLGLGIELRDSYMGSKHPTNASTSSYAC